MESLKGGEWEKRFMDLARMLMEGELEEMKGHENYKENMDSFPVCEFFTGFIPFFTFAVFSQSFSTQFEQDEKLTEDCFIDSFLATHLAHHDFK